MSRELIAAIRAVQRLDHYTMGIDFAYVDTGAKPRWVGGSAFHVSRDRHLRVELTLELFARLLSDGYKRAAVSIGGYAESAKVAHTYRDLLWPTNAHDDKPWARVDEFSPTCVEGGWELRPCMLDVGRLFKP